ncbi:MAG: tRNA (adenosine(37)-N6)-dimethylallyltransferase MiaA [Bacteroidaceae bacterium]|nr:tRNA (adenosine(37)-N6)-dimethylallyltransferase MiaA [Bacteroidaceae bacterium]
MAHSLITILGPTASGKTSIAVSLAARIGGEIISGDSRQVYRGMDLGTGKDLDEYGDIPYHLIDICPAGEKYNVFRFQNDFLAAYNDIVARHRTPILCGGSGLYIESVLRGYRLQDVPQNDELRASLAGKSIEELTGILSSYKSLHNTTDVDTAKRAIRAIEIEEFYRTHPIDERPFPHIDSYVIGVDVPREVRRERISRRLRARLDSGMVEEVRALLTRLAPEDLIYYGLEYKFLTLYIIGRLTYDGMVTQLETAIHQFAKRQMTYFRGMERRGVTIHWRTPGELAGTDWMDELADESLIRN